MNILKPSAGLENENPIIEKSIDKLKGIFPVNKVYELQNIKVEAEIPKDTELGELYKNTVLHLLKAIENIYKDSLAFLYSVDLMRESQYALSHSMISFPGATEALHLKASQIQDIIDKQFSSLLESGKQKLLTELKMSVIDPCSAQLQALCDVNNKTIAYNKYVSKINTLETTGSVKKLFSKSSYDQGKAKIEKKEKKKSALKDSLAVDMKHLKENQGKIFENLAVSLLECQHRFLNSLAAGYGETKPFSCELLVWKPTPFPDLKAAVSETTINPVLEKTTKN